MSEKAILPVTIVDQDTKEVKNEGILITPNKEQFKSTVDYYPDQIVGACEVCLMVGTIDFQQGFSWKIGDNLMSRQRIKCFCPLCKSETTFIPIKINGEKTPEYIKILAKIEKKIQENLKKGAGNGDERIN